MNPLAKQFIHFTHVKGFADKTLFVVYAVDTDKFLTVDNTGRIEDVMDGLYDIKSACKNVAEGHWKIVSEHEAMKQTADLVVNNTDNAIDFLNSLLDDMGVPKV